MNEDFIVYLRGGTYELDRPLAFTDLDSGTGGHRIAFRAFLGEAPVISGGVKITNWSEVAGTKIWQAKAPVGLRTRQLYVNGVRANRASAKAGSLGAFLVNPTGYTTTNISLQQWKNPVDIEFVFASDEGGGTPWTESRCGVAAISGDATKTVVTMKQPAHTNTIHRGNVTVQKPTVIENAFELLDEPGEWYLNSATDTVYYLPRAGEDLRHAEVIAPRLEMLLHGKGTPSHPIQNLLFQGITFSYATWLGPSGSNGFAELQANYIVTQQPATNAMAPANVYFKAAHNVFFENCTFSHLGAQGLAFDHGSQNNSIIGNIFTDISGTALRVGDVDEPHAFPNAQDRGNKICNNYIHDNCVEYHGGTGLFAGYVADTEISHNEICNQPYTGISVGWGWGAESYMENNRITSNRIANVMLFLRDGGAIYTLSPQSNSVLTGNYIVNCKWNGLYHDEGTCYYTDRSNVVDTVGGNWLSLWTASIRHNDIQTNWYNKDALQNGGVSNIIANNILFTPETWPAGARTITNSAGLEPAFRALLHK